MQESGDWRLAISRQWTYMPTTLSLIIPRVCFYISPAAKHCFHRPTANISRAGLFISFWHFFLYQEVSGKEGETHFNILLWVGSVLKSFDSVDHLPGQKHTITPAMLASALGTSPQSRMKEWEGEKQFWINSTSSSFTLFAWEEMVKPALRFSLFSTVCARPAINQSSLFPPFFFFLFFPWEPL